MTLQENQTYSIVADELAVLICDCQTEQVGIEGACTLLQFGMAFEIQNQDFWKVVQDKVDAALAETDDAEAVCKILAMSNYCQLNKAVLQEKAASLIMKDGLTSSYLT